MDKVLIKYCGKYLQEIKIRSALVDNEIFESNVVKLVMSGGYCVRGKQGIVVVTEASSKLQLLPFTKSRYSSIFGGFFKCISTAICISKT